MEAGLLDEVYHIYDPDADYTRGLKQAIGVREFEKFFSTLFSGSEKDHQSIHDGAWGGSMKFISMMAGHEGGYQPSTIDLLRRVRDTDDSHLMILLNEAIEELKANTRRLVRRQVSSAAHARMHSAAIFQCSPSFFLTANIVCDSQRRRLNRLRTDFGWSLRCIDATEAFESRASQWSSRCLIISLCLPLWTPVPRLKGWFSHSAGRSEDSWRRAVVEPCVSLVKAFLSRESVSPAGSAVPPSLASRDLWTRYICEVSALLLLENAESVHSFPTPLSVWFGQACGNRVLRGAHEWEQHRKGRGHRKRAHRNRKAANPSSEGELVIRSA